MDPPLALSIAFRRGWQWPFREGDTLRVYVSVGTLFEGSVVRLRDGCFRFPFPGRCRRGGKRKRWARVIAG
jgi:hypothetical protein